MLGRGGEEKWALSAKVKNNKRTFHSVRMEKHKFFYVINVDKKKKKIVVAQSEINAARINCTRRILWFYHSVDRFYR